MTKALFSAEDFNNLTLLASGGEHLVYTSSGPKFTGKVIKINYVSVKKLLEINLDEHQPLTNIPNSWLEFYQQLAKRRTQENHELQQYFDLHVPQTQVFIVKVKISSQFINSLYPSSQPPFVIKDIQQLPALVTVQDRVAIQQSKYQWTFYFNSLDTPNLTKIDIENMCDNFYYDGRIDYSSEIAKFYPSLNDPGMAMQKYPQLKLQIKDFIEKLINYVSFTAKGIDFYGKHNIIFYKIRGRFDYTLLDAVLLDSVNFLREFQRFNAWLKGDKVGTNIDDVVPHQLHRLRGINALAWKSGSTHRLRQLQGHDLTPFAGQIAKYLILKI